MKDRRVVEWIPVARAAVDPTMSGTLPGLPPRVTTVRLPSLRYWRVQRALNQEELAEHANVSMATLWRLETGRPATLDTARKLAAALGVEPADLMSQPPAG